MVRALIDGGARRKDDWLWQKQLRYYLGPDNSAVISMVDGEFEYTYEYQGRYSVLS